eukprot:PITA_25713
MSMMIQNEPSSFSGAIKHQVWKDAMIEEYDSMMKNDVWEVVPRPQDKTIVTSKWPYQIKNAADGSMEKLKKALYGQKQAPRAWYERIDSYLMKLGFTRSEVGPNFYFKVEDDKPLILVLYVDDLFLTGTYLLIHKCKRELASKLEMKDLGLEVWHKTREIFLSPGKYVMKILERFGMVDYKPATTRMELDFKKLSSSVVGIVLRNATEYQQLVGAFMFSMNSCPDICFAVNTLSQHMVEPHHIHWIGAKNLLRYLRGTIIYGLRYTIRDVRLLGYTNADWASNVEDHKSTFGCCFSLGSTLISWMRRKKKSVALSTAEAEYIAASMASCEVVSFRKLFNELFGFTLDTTVILCDNQSGICLSKNPVFHDHSKHIDIRYHYIRNMVQWGAIRL